MTCVRNQLYVEMHFPFGRVSLSYPEDVVA